MSTHNLPKRSEAFHKHTVRQPIGGVGRRCGIKLPVQIAVLRVGTIAKVGPETVKSPRVWREKLSLRLESGVGGPELSAEEEATERLGAAGVDAARIGSAGAREDCTRVSCLLISTRIHWRFVWSFTHSIDKCD